MKHFLLYFTALVLLPFQLLSIEKNAMVEDIINNVNIDSLSHTIKILSGAEPYRAGDTTAIIKTRLFDSDDNLEAANFLMNKLSSYGLDAGLYECGIKCENVIAVQRGSEFPDIYVIIGAHFDSYSIQGGNAPGADDNATGSAVVMEAARLLSEQQTSYTVIYALWDAEESGMIGSGYYARQAKLNGDSVLVVINCDMLGWDGNNGNKMDIHTKNVGVSVRAADLCKELNELYEIGLNARIVNPGISSSDHESFLSRGISAIFLTEDHDVSHSDVNHTGSDLFENLTLDYYLKNAKLAIATISQFATGADSFISSVEDGDTAENSINVYPNPASEYSTIKLYLNESNYVDIEVYDSYGKLISNVYSGYPDAGHQSFNLSGINSFGSGVYYCTVLIGGMVQTKKLVVLR